MFSTRKTPGVFLKIFFRMNWKENPLIKYFIEAKAELKKVVWPTRKETIQYTLVVIGVSLGVALFLSAVDYGLSQGLSLLIK